MNATDYIIMGMTITFIVLKLAGNIAWSWWWVLSPLWIIPALFAITVAGQITLRLLSKIGGRNVNTKRSS